MKLFAGRIFGSRFIKKYFFLKPLFVLFVIIKMDGTNFKELFIPNNSPINNLINCFTKKIPLLVVQKSRGVKLTSYKSMIISFVESSSNRMTCR
ncbi:MAG: hypothetical protein QG635_721 [Bacteroidota bacterium]|nr:hypothetical protein [Bacteroidota bacterium]